MNKPLLISDDLLVKHLLGEASPDEQVRVAQWLEEDAGNRKYYEQFALIWEESKALSARVEVDEEAAWNQFTNRIENTTSQKQQQGRIVRMVWIKRLSVAAVLLLVTGVISLYYINREKNNITLVREQSASRTVIDTLSDGSIITLNKNTTLEYPSRFTGDRRPVTLKGEAFFSISPDKKKPFIIGANGVTITVVGTSFNVKSYPDSTQIIVESGIVRVSRGQSVIELHKGEQATVINHSSLKKEATKDSLYRYYRTATFDCNNTPLSSVLQTLNEAYNAHLVAGSEAVSRLRLTATFRKEERLETIVGIIQQTFNLQVTKQADSLVFNLNTTATTKEEKNK